MELLEESAAFLETARAQLPAARVRAFHASSLQGFAPPAHVRYAAVWVQWVLIYLTDADLVAFLSRCAAALVAPHGRIVVKESVSKEEHGFFVDRSDASITRTDAHHRRLFAAAGLAVAHSEAQPGLPHGVFAVRMYVLRPVEAPAAGGAEAQGHDSSDRET